MSTTTKVDPSLAPLMVDASIESYYAFDPHDPVRFDPQGITPPPGYDLVDCWTGIDTIEDAYLIAPGRRRRRQRWRAP